MGRNGAEIRFSVAPRLRRIVQTLPPERRRRMLFPAFERFSDGVQYFFPQDGEAYAAGKPCKGFGSVRYAEGSLYCGDLYFDGKAYNKLGYGRQDFMLSEIGVLNEKNKVRKAFFLGFFDYRKTDWIYGNGALFFVDEQNKPVHFMKGFFEGLNKVADYEGAFDYARLPAGFTPEMECEFDDRADVFESAFDHYRDITEMENLFIGDSYFEFWNKSEFADELFYERFDKTHNLNLGVGGTRFSDWKRFIPKLEKIKRPKRIVLNLGFNDIHGNRTAEDVFSGYTEILSMLRQYFPDSEYVLLNIVKAPAFSAYYAEEEKFIAMTERARARLGVKVFDMRAVIEETQKGGNCFSADNVHLNAAGYRAYAAAIGGITEGE